MPRTYLSPSKTIDLAVIDRGFDNYDVYFGSHLIGTVKGHDADFVEAQAIQMFKAFLKRED